jgi:hypothetical protein
VRRLAVQADDDVLERGRFFGEARFGEEHAFVALTQQLDQPLLDVFVCFSIDRPYLARGHCRRLNARSWRPMGVVDSDVTLI